jgi:hypothetical protein
MAVFNKLEGGKVLRITSVPLFIAKENQEMLWKLIHHIPHVESMDYSYKVKWFKSIIENVYESDISNLSLREINVKTIEYICYLMKNTQQQTDNQNQEDMQMDKPTQEPFHHFQNKVSSEMREKENQKDIYSIKFEEINKEYEKMLDKKPPIVPIFESIKDEPIQNLEELVKNHLLNTPFLQDEGS